MDYETEYVSPEWHFAQVSRIADEATEKYMEKDYDSSIRLCTQALGIISDLDFSKDLENQETLISLQLRIYNCRGNAYQEKGECNRAIQDYDKAIALDTSQAVFYSNRGNAYQEKNEYDRAIQDYDKAIELNPKHANAYSNRGSAYQEKGEHDRAIQDYDKAIKINPKHANAYFKRGSVYRTRREYDHAIQDFERAVGLNPEREVFRDSLAIAQEEKRVIRNLKEKEIAETFKEKEAVETFKEKQTAKDFNEKGEIHTTPGEELPRKTTNQNKIIEIYEEREKELGKTLLRGRIFLMITTLLCVAIVLFLGIGWPILFFETFQYKIYGFVRPSSFMDKWLFTLPMLLPLLTAYYLLLSELARQRNEFKQHQEAREDAFHKKIMVLYPLLLEMPEKRDKNFVTPVKKEAEEAIKNVDELGTDKTGVK